MNSRSVWCFLTSNTTFQHQTVLQFSDSNRVSCNSIPTVNYLELAQTPSGWGFSPTRLAFFQTLHPIPRLLALLTNLDTNSGIFPTPPSHLVICWNKHKVLSLLLQFIIKAARESQMKRYIAEAVGDTVLLCLLRSATLPANWYLHQPRIWLDFFQRRYSNGQRYIKQC